MTGPSRLAGAWASRRASDHDGLARRFLAVAGRWPPGAIAGLATIVLLQAGGSVAGWNTALQEMGFDPDRATLISALTVGALSAAAAALVSGRRALPVAIAFVGLGSTFGGAFVAETSAALAVGGQQGFSAGGWLATLVTLLIAGAVTGWAMSGLALEVRPWLLSGWGLARDIAGQLAGRRAAPDGPASAGPSPWRAVRTLVPIALVGVTLAALPTFADMINYTPDVAMTGGGLAQAAPLVGAGPGGVGGGSAGSAAGGSGSAPATGSSAGQAAAPAPSAPPATVAPGAVSAARPWAAAPPTGQGRIVTFTLPSPWTGTRVTRSTVWLYLPPGYGTGTQRYPVIYTVPWDFSHWELGIHVQAMLDQAITQGTIPPSIVAFVDLAGGPFPNSECADSFDGREHADTYASQTVVAYVDAHYRTSATADARTVAGFSQGGFCAANLLLRHPAVFHQAVIFAGYFVAGLKSGETVNAWRPWGNVPALIAANSPMTTAGTLPQAARGRLFIVMAAQPDLGVFGQQASAFATVLARDGYATDFLWNRYGHAWAGVRLEFLPALQAVAAREVQTGVLR